MDYTHPEYLIFPQALNGCKTSAGHQARRGGGHLVPESAYSIFTVQIYTNQIVERLTYIIVLIVVPV